MGIITVERIAELIEEAPGWALVALTMPQEGLREAARHELATHVYNSLYALPADHGEQLALPLG
ncbi:DUF6771 family protein [Sphingomonas sp. CFBP 8760]|uniref:DUF6771 family protein n=1 Tax=Sphingomonas sp. CFBP 8760 TaxID=2775282 RepID=UPI0017833584|nr:DUF6771 family protein [Sphingomonas sp. CFBP 8760]MBD8546069.1 hypothetical protein [Sphingomonas sp. CFBP 8760]